MPPIPAKQSFESLATADFERLAKAVPLRAPHGQHILMTGATGFFGTWLLHFLAWLEKTGQGGNTVYALSRDPPAFLAKHPAFSRYDWLHWIKGDVRDFAFPGAELDAILHAATDTSAQTGKNSLHLFDVIVQGTHRVLSCARQTKAKRVLLVSSGAVYGKQPRDVTHLAETMTANTSAFQSADAYTEGKRIMELLGAQFAKETNVPVVVARCFAFTDAGLPLDEHFAIGNFIRDALTRDKIIIRSGGTAERSYLYAADLAVWLFRLMREGRSGDVYNVGSDAPVSIAELARQVVSVLAPGKAVSVEGVDDPNAGRNRYIPSVDKARAELGLDVWTTLPQAIALTAAYGG